MKNPSTLGLLIAARAPESAACADFARRSEHVVMQGNMVISWLDANSSGLNVSDIDTLSPSDDYRSAL